MISRRTRPELERRSRASRTRSVTRLAFERLENRCVLSAFDSVAQAAIDLGIDPIKSATGEIAQLGGQDVYRVTLDTPGRVVANVHPNGFRTLLSLLDDQGNVVIQSEATSPANPDGELAQHLPAGTYYVSVSSQNGIGTFDLTTSFTAALAPLTPMSEGSGAFGVIAADLNGDGIPDIVMPDYYDNQLLVNFGVGDGTYQPAVAVPTDSGPVQVVAGDFTGNGIVDLAVADQVAGDIVILLGNGDGTFRPGATIATDAGPTGLLATDFNRDGRIDLAVANQAADTVQILLGHGDGSFTPSDRIAGLGGATGLAAADFNGDGSTDLAVACKDEGQVVILQGQGNGTFLTQQDLTVGPGCSSVVAADFNGDGRPELAALSSDNGTVSVFATRADGTLVPTVTLSAGTRPFNLVAADFHGNGWLDLAVCNYGSNTVSLFPGNGDGTFQPAATLSAGSGPIALAAADLSGHGHMDLAVSDFIGLTVSVLINNGDGTFKTPPPIPPSAGPEDVVAADLTGNGILDLVVPCEGTNAVSILLGRGDGTFRDPIQVPTGSDPYDATVGDFNGDGIPDLAVINYFSNTVWVYQGKGDGTFEHTETLTTGEGPVFIKTADLTGNGHLDLIVANYLSNNLSVYQGRGDGTFSDPVNVSVGEGPSGLTISDFNRDGRPDIAVSDSGSNDVEVLLNLGGLSFAAPVSYPAGNQPWSATTADFNGDGRADLVVSDFGSSSPSVISILFGNGDGTFSAPAAFPVGDGPYPVGVGDFNGDGHSDIVVGNDGTNDLSLLLGEGNGQFAPEIRLPSGKEPYGIAVGDFRRDGHLSIATANAQSNDVTVNLGAGDGTFSNPVTVPLTQSRVPMATADFNGNGLIDMAVANPTAGTVTIRLAQGDGTFVDETPINVGGEPSALVAGDFNGDGRTDIAVSDARTGSILILLGLGDGQFDAPIRVAIGGSPDSLVTGDFNDDGHIDLAVGDSKSNDITILYGVGDGTFQVGSPLAVGAEPVALVAADLRNNGSVDLVVADRSSGDLTFFWNDGAGNFQRTSWTTPDLAPSAIVAADFDGDGRVDLAVADQTHSRVLILWGQGGGTFSAPQSLPVGQGPDALAASDLDGADDGSADLVVADAGSQDLTIFRGLAPGSHTHAYTIPIVGQPAGIVAGLLSNSIFPDLAVANASTGTIDVLLGGGDGVFSPPQVAVPLPGFAPEADPYGYSVVTTDRNGQILVRLSRPGSPGEFAAPQVVTADGSGNTARQIVPITTPQGLSYACLDLHKPLVVFAQPEPSGAYQLTDLPLPDGGIYTRIAAGDLEHDGLDDLLVLDHASNRIIVFRQDANGQFREDVSPLDVGCGPTDLMLADLNHDGQLDLIVANGASGDLSVFYGSPDGQFGPQIRLAAGLSPAATIAEPSGLKRSSPDEPIGVATGVLNPGSGLTDVAVVLRGSDQLSILQGTPGGGLANPSPQTTYPTGLEPTEVVAAPLERDGLIDLIVLNTGSHDISIYRNNGDGTFTVMPRVDAGNDPTGVSVADENADGVPDLVVGNTAGDVLILIGNGDGTFKPYTRADRSVSLAFGDLTGTGQPSIVLTNTSQDLLSVQSLQSTYSFLQGRSNGLLAPGPVAIADMNNDGIPDLIVVNSGANDVLVYLGLGGGRFATPEAFYTGTDPVGLTVANLDGSGSPDLVVTNAGSNDVTILLSDCGPNGWTMVPGPRLQVGERPVSAAVANLSGNGNPDLFVVNQDSNSVTMLRGVGNGFFDDQHPVTFATGLAPVQAFVGRFSSAQGPGLVVLNSLSNDMTFYPSVTQGATASVTIPTGGVDPVAAVMGNFTNNGFADLVIAHNGDSQINLFEGTPSGLVLANSVSLADSVHPTDLVVSSNEEGGIQLYVSAEGEGQVIPVTITAVSPTIDATGALGTGGPQASARVSTPGATTPSPGFSLLTQEESVMGLGLQSQVSAVQFTQTETTTASASVVISIVSQALSTFSKSSLRSLTGLVDDLVQTGDIRTSEIMPLGESDMATVAVILSVSSTLDRGHENIDDLEVPDRTGKETEASESTFEIRDHDEPVQASLLPVALFLAQPHASWDRWNGTLGSTLLGPSHPDSEWVWHVANPQRARFVESPANRPSPKGAEPPSDSPESQPVVVNGAIERDLAPDSLAQTSPMLVLRSGVLPVCTLFTALLVGWRLWRARLRRGEAPISTDRLPGSSVRSQRTPHWRTNSFRHNHSVPHLPPRLQESLPSSSSRSRGVV